MATITPTVSPLSALGDTVAFKYAFTMANGDQGTPLLNASQWEDVSIQVEGTFGAGGSATLQGSNDGSNWRALTTDGNTAIALTAPGIKRAAERCDQYRPAVTAGDGTTALTVTIVARRKQTR